MHTEIEIIFLRVAEQAMRNARFLGVVERMVGSFVLNELEAAGFAIVHQQHAYGRPKSPSSKTPLVSFHRSFTPEPTTGCWLWTGPVNAYGYPVFNGDGRQEMAHRWAFRAFGGRLRGKQTVDHLCGQPLCVNPEHLEGTSRAENTRRMLERRALARAQSIMLARAYIASHQPQAA